MASHLNLEFQYKGPEGKPQPAANIEAEDLKVLPEEFLVKLLSVVEAAEGKVTKDQIETIEEEAQSLAA